MNRGVVSKVVTSFGSLWGRIKPHGEEREIFFNPASLVDPSRFDLMAIGVEVEFDEEPARAEATHAVRVRPVVP